VNQQHLEIEFLDGQLDLLIEKVFVAPIGLGVYDLITISKSILRFSFKAAWLKKLTSP